MSFIKQNDAWVGRGGVDGLRQVKLVPTMSPLKGKKNQRRIKQYSTNQMRREFLPFL